jgi:hypothetical protein
MHLNKELGPFYVPRMHELFSDTTDRHFQLVIAMTSLKLFTFLVTLNSVLQFTTSTMFHSPFSPSRKSGYYSFVQSTFIFKSSCSSQSRREHLTNIILLCKWHCLPSSKVWSARSPIQSAGQGTWMTLLFGSHCTAVQTWFIVQWVGNRRKIGCL